MPAHCAIVNKKYEVSLIEFLTVLSSFDYLLIVVSFFTSFLTAMLGLGGGVVLLAVMVTVYPPSVVIPVHGVIQMGSNFFRMGLMRRFIDKTVFVSFLIGSLLGAFIGAHFVVALDEQVLKIILAFFVLYLVWAPTFKIMNVKLKLGFYIGGFLTTFASLFVGSSGPIGVAFIARKKMAKEIQVGTIATCMFMVHILKTAVFGFIGFAYSEYTLLIILMITTGFAGTYVGRQVLFKLPEHLFQAAYKVVITLLALNILYSVFV